MENLPSLLLYELAHYCVETQYCSSDLGKITKIKPEHTQCFAVLFRGLRKSYNCQLRISDTPPIGLERCIINTMPQIAQKMKRTFHIMK